MCRHYTLRGPETVADAKQAIGDNTGDRRVGSERAVGMELEKPFLTALELFNEKRAVS